MTTTLSTTSVLEAIDAAFPFTVSKHPLSGPDNMPTEHYGLFRSDTCAGIGNAVRKGYQPHTLDDVKALTEAGMAAFGEAGNVLECGWRDGHRISIGPSDARRKEIFGSKDAIFPRFVIEAGYNGTAFKAGLGYYRDTCKNLAMLRLHGGQNITRITHTSGLRDKMGELVDQFSRLAEGWEALAETAAEMQSRKLVTVEFIAKIFPEIASESSRSRSIAKKKVWAVIDRIAKERQQLTGSTGDLKEATAWELYNGVQGFVQHDQTRRGNPTSFDRAMMAMQDATVKTALGYALAG